VPASNDPRLGRGKSSAKVLASAMPVRLETWERSTASQRDTPMAPMMSRAASTVLRW
jgi:hypothetical protein